MSFYRGLVVASGIIRGWVTMTTPDVAAWLMLASADGRGRSTQSAVTADTAADTAYTGSTSMTHPL